MKLTKILSTLFGLSLFLSVAVVFAQDLTLTRIGVLSTVGVDYAIVDYTGSIPTLEGTASPSATVLIKIKTSTDATIAASPSGIWRFTPGVLDSGSNAIVITSEGETVSFVLNFNATPSATVTPTPAVIPEELPATGIWENYLLAIGAGILVLFFGRYLKNKMTVWEGKKK